MSNVGVWDIKFHSIIFPDVRIYLSTEAYCFAITHTMVSHIHYNGYFEFCRVSSVFSSSFFHKKYAPPKVSNFWGAYQNYPPIFMSFIIFSPIQKSAQAFLHSHAFATQNASRLSICSSPLRTTLTLSPESFFSVDTSPL